MAAEVHGTAEPSPPEGFGKADFAFWATVACWTPNEAAILSLDLDPEIRESTLVPETAQLDLVSYRRRELLILRAIEAGQLPSPLTPRAFVAWAKQRGIEIPENLRLAVIDDSRQHDDVTVGDNCHTKEAASMLKMILGMARGCYAWNPNDLRSTVVSDILHDLDKVGISLSANTIRSRLKEAYDRYGSQSVDEDGRA